MLQIIRRKIGTFKKTAKISTSATPQGVNFKASWGQMYYRKINNCLAISNNRKVLNVLSVYLHSKQ